MLLFTGRITYSFHVTDMRNHFASTTRLLEDVDDFNYLERETLVNRRL